MTKGGRIAGGILAIVGGAFIVIAGIMILSLISYDPSIMISVIATLASGALAVIGGILLLVDSTAGGVLALIGGAFCIVGSFIPIYMTIPLTVHFFNFWIDPALALVGGIVGLAVGSSK